MFHLNQGKQTDQINTLFVAEDGSRYAWLDGRNIDLDGDNKDEVVFIASIYIDKLKKNENIYWIAKKVTKQYEVAYSKVETTSYAATIEIVSDLNNDNLPDLVFIRPLPGNGTGAVIFLTRYKDASFSIQQVAETNLIISETKTSSQDKDDANNLIVVGFEPGWGSSGPGRTVKEIYSYNGEKFTLIQSQHLSDDFRIHVLEDAQTAYNSGNEKLAVKLWEQAAYDQSLINYPSMWIDNDLPEIYQPAFAVYRLYTYYLSVNDKEKSGFYWTKLNNNYPEGSPGGEFIPLAVEAKRLLEKSEDTDFVCTGIYEFLNSTIENVNFLMHHWYWGDHNRDIVDFCPLKR